MASSSEVKDENVEKQKVAGSSEDFVDESKRDSSDLIDGRIFEADAPIPLSTEEEADTREFQATLKKYNDLSKKMRKDALEEEKQELSAGEKSPKMRYYEGTRSERLKILEAETKLMEEMEKKVGQRA